jgi:hypothetical protein
MSDLSLHAAGRDCCFEIDCDVKRLRRRAVVLEIWEATRTKIAQMEACFAEMMIKACFAKHWVAVLRFHQGVRWSSTGPGGGEIATVRWLTRDPLSFQKVDVRRGSTAINPTEDEVTAPERRRTALPLKKEKAAKQEEVQTFGAALAGGPCENRGPETEVAEAVARSPTTVSSRERDLRKDKAEVKSKAPK